LSVDIVFSPEVFFFSYACHLPEVMAFYSCVCITAGDNDTLPSTICAVITVNNRWWCWLWL